ncbi:MAG: SRPBCC family protein [Candidatus Hodarchaeota archaeon]
MKTLRDSIEINTKPERIYQWLKDLDKNYKKWHQDHVNAIKLTNTSELKIGDIFCYEEYLHGELHKLKFKLINVEKNRLIEFKTFFPASLICPKGSFLIEPKNDGSIFTATLSFRMGNTFSKFAKSRVEAIKKHMKEEGKNLKRILESE